ncbi:MAG: diacylglycerol/lipid kinase family protein [Bacteroidales bacterium]
MTDKGKEPILFIINPIAGIRSKTNLENSIRRHLDTKRYEPEFRYTEYKGHGTKLARKAIKRGVQKIIAVGGDGTVNEVGAALVGKDAALGIIPVGSGNGLARHLRIPVRVKEAINVINHGKVVNIDYGLVNGIPFFCTCGVGFDAFVGMRFAESEQRGFITYVKTTLSEYVHYKPKKYRLKAGKTKVASRAFLVTFANAAQWGNNAYISPHADIQDGKLDICILAPFPRFRALNIGYRLFSKKLHKSPYLRVLRTDKAILKRKKAGAVHYDGEPAVMKKKITLESVHRGLKVIVHEHSKWK